MLVGGDDTISLTSADVVFSVHCITCICWEAPRESCLCQEVPYLTSTTMTRIQSKSVTIRTDGTHRWTRISPLWNTILENTIQVTTPLITKPTAKMVTHATRRIDAVRACLDSIARTGPCNTTPTCYTTCAPKVCCAKHQTSQRCAPKDLLAALRPQKLAPISPRHAETTKTRREYFARKGRR